MLCFELSGHRGGALRPRAAPQAAGAARGRCPAALRGSAGPGRGCCVSTASPGSSSSCLALARACVHDVCKSLGMSIWFPSPVPPPASRPGSSVTGDILNSQEIGESLIVFSSLFFFFSPHAAEQKVHPQFSPCPWEAVYQDWVSVQDVYFIFLHYKSFWNLILLATKLCLELRAQGVNSCRPSLLVLILLIRPPIHTGYCLSFFFPHLKAWSCLCTETLWQRLSSTGRYTQGRDWRLYSLSLPSPNHAPSPLISDFDTHPPHSPHS